jgi:hypothetical protein
MNKSYWLILLIICLVGCAKKNTKHIKQAMEKTSFVVLSQTEIQELLALHSEIPDTPLGLCVEKVTVDILNSHAFEILYKLKKNTQLTFEMLEKSYVADMEFLGWQLVGKCLTENLQLLFQRPGTVPFCLIIIQQNKTVQITVLPKKRP